MEFLAKRKAYVIILVTRGFVTCSCCTLSLSDHYSTRTAPLSNLSS